MPEIEAPRDGSRRPLVAANWKMHKTTGEAEALPRGAARPSGSRTAIDVGRLPAVHGAGRRRSSRRAARRSGSAPRTCTRRSRGRSPARSRSRCSPTSASPARSSATPSAASSSARPTRRWRARSRRCSPPSMLAILCCGETEAERDAGETEAVLRRQLEADLAGVADDDLGRVVIAYEPIWAIGTGRTATPEQAQEACAFIRGLIARSRRRRRRGDPDPLRRLGEARQRRRAVRARRRRRRPGRRRQPRPGRLRARSAGAA